MKMEAIGERFDSMWWDGFLETTQQMSTPCVFKNCITESETTQMRRYILDILADFSRQRSIKYGMRLWVDGKQADDLSSFYDCPPLDGEDIPAWTKRAFGEKKFGIILNRGEKFSKELSRLLAYRLQPLLEKIGMPTEGFLFTIFIGNYDNTPLGIHKDLPGKSVMHFHLGPGSKDMYTWNDADYESRAGATVQGNQDIAPHLPYATRHHFEEGDIYFMPENRYHVGTQEGLSIGIACWCNNRSNFQFAEQLLFFMRNNFLKDSTLMLKADRNDLENLSGLDKTLALFDIPEHLDNLRFKDLLSVLYKDLRYALYSNAGYRNAPLPNEDKVTLDIDSVIQLEAPYKLLYYIPAESDKLVLFSRGTRLEMKNLPEIRGMIDLINKGEQISVREILQGFSDAFPRESIYYLLKQIYKYNGIAVL